VKRILYYSDNQLHIFHWLKNQCIANFKFKLDASGLEKLKSYLLSAEKTPVRLLLDLMTEEFNQTKIPHVGLADRKAIINRQISRDHPNSKDYINHNIRGREKSNRQDDILFYSVLSNPDILDPILNILKQCHIPVSGIWSIPLLSDLLLSKISSNSTNVILISQQTSGIIRQTFFKNNKLINSRLTKIYLNPDSSYQNITEEIDQTVHFLINQGFIKLNEIIDIKIIFPDSHLIKVKLNSNADICNFYFHTPEEISQLLHYKSAQTEFSNEIFSYLCSSSSILSGHYWPRSVFNMYYQQFLTIFLKIISITLVICSLLCSAFYLSKSKSLNMELITLKHLETGIKNEYNIKFSKIENSFYNIQIMESSVLLSQQIIHTRFQSPQKIMSRISKALTPSHVSSLQFTKYSWRQIQSDSISDITDQPVSRQIDYADITPIFYYAKLTGVFLNTQDDLSIQRKLLHSIVDNISNLNPDWDVKLIKSPFTSTSNSEIEHERSASQKKTRESHSAFSEFQIAILVSGSKI
jgi:hypothetical protein